MKMTANRRTEDYWTHPVAMHEKRSGYEPVREPDMSGAGFSPTWLKFISTNGVQRAPVTLSDLIETYRASHHYQGLALSSQKSYDWLIERIEEKFGFLLLEDFGKKGARTAIRQWRDSLMANPTSADRTMGVFRLILNFGVGEEYLARNPLSGIGTVHKGSRRDIIWSDEQIATFLDRAPRHLSRALLLAVWTGQRQSDLLSLKWSDYDGRYITLQQKKMGRGSSGRRVKILVSRELRSVLEEIEAEQIYRSQLNGRKRVDRPDVILTTARGIPWKRGFKTPWRKAVANAGITGLTFHDLRGTFITLAYRAGSSIREIAEASGHEEKECERIIQRHYLSTGAEDVISRLEKSKRFTSPKWKLSPNGGTGRPLTHRFTGPRRPRDGAKYHYS